MKTQRARLPGIFFVLPDPSGISFKRENFAGGDSYVRAVGEEANQVQACDARRGRAPASHVTAVSAPFFLIAPTPLSYLLTLK